MSLTEYLYYYGAVLWNEALQHALLAAVAVLLASVIGFAAGVATWHRRALANAVIAACGALLTIPSLALFGVLIPLLGLGWTPSVVALVLYSLLPIVRNTIVGLRAVDGAIVESARGMGLGRLRLLVRIQLPLAWPYILAGIRTATQMAVALAVVAAYVDGPGLGNPIFDGLNQLGAVNAVNEALTGTVAVVLVALAFDLFYVLLRRLTTPRGLRV